MCDTRSNFENSSIWLLFSLIIFYFLNKGQVWVNFTCENICNIRTAMNRQEWRNYLLNYSNRLETWPCKMSPTCSTLFISHQRLCSRKFPLIRHTRSVLEQDQLILPWNLMEYSTRKRITGVGFFLVLFLFKSYINRAMVIVCWKQFYFYILIFYIWGGRRIYKKHVKYETFCYFWPEHYF